MRISNYVTRGACVFLTAFTAGICPQERPIQPASAARLPNLTSVTAIANVNVIPMDSERVLMDQTVVLEGGLIRSITPTTEADIPEGAQIIEATGQYLMPGLFDMHAHPRRTEGNREEDYLRHGITGLRNMQGNPGFLGYRKSVQSGGPIFFTAGPAIAGFEIDRRHRIVTDTSDARAVVREHQQAGYDFIKVYSFLSLDVYDSILDEAHTLNIRVVGHVSDNVKASRAIAAGQSSIEHMYGYFWELESAASELQGEWEGRRLFHAVEIDDTKLPELARRTAAAHVWNCPTLWRKDNVLTSPLAEEAWNTPRLRDLGHANRMKLVKALHDAGAGLLVGTDDRAEVIHDELALFVEAGLTPYEAIHAATVGASAYLGIDASVGTIAVGKRAHLVLLGASPLDNIENTKSIVRVFVDGQLTPTPAN